MAAIEGIPPDCNTMKITTLKKAYQGVQELITKKEVARRLHVTQRSVDNYTNSGSSSD